MHPGNKPNPIGGVTEKIEDNSTLDIVALENIVAKNLNEFMRKLELGRELKRIITENKIMKASLSEEHREALKLFVKHGQDKDIQPVEWRRWQKELLKYVNNPTDRRIIWVVGGKGDEGKSFFMKKIRGKYGRHRVCVMNLKGKSKDILHYMKKVVDIPTELFLFNIPKGVNMGDIEYTLLEDIKDGDALAEKYETTIVEITTPNVIIVFANDYPDTGKLSPDRWLILKINAGMEIDDVTEAKLMKKRGGGDANKNGNNT